MVIDTSHLDVEAALRASKEQIAIALAGSPETLAKAIEPIGAGGKRLRGRALWWCSALGGCPPFADATRLMAAIELMHLATLVHDDIIDGAHTRRNAPSVNAVAGLNGGLLLGDRLIGESFKLASAADRRASAELADALVLMCDAQYNELKGAFNPDRTVEDVISIAIGKTGRLFQAAYTLGATIAGLNAADVDALGRVGADLGTAFQLIDDLHDFIDSPEDLAQGNFTCAVLRAAERDPSLRGLLERAPATAHSTLVAAARTTGAISDAADDALLLLAAANQRLAQLDADRGAVAELMTISRRLEIEATELSSPASHIPTA